MSAHLDPRWGAALGQGEDTDVIETHGAWVVLAGAHAYKLKKPVNLGYLDFSTRDKRQAALEAELRLNQPGAPMVYLHLGWLTEDAAGRWALDGDGVAQEPVLVMRRFRQDQLLDHLARTDGISDALACDLARVVWDQHQRAAPVMTPDNHARQSDVLQALTLRLSAHAGFEAQADDVSQLVQARLNDQAALLRQRGRTGAVRQCHGDLHLRNMVCLDGRAVLFDALEFDADMACIDWAYDLAFLVMDLADHDQGRALSVLLSHYAAQLDLTEIAGLGVLPVLSAIRALVRALVTLDRGGPGDCQTAQQALALSRAFAALPTSRLIGVGGLSGSGKSTLATALAPQIAAPLGAVVIRADLERKAMAGVPWHEPLPASAYTAEQSARVYARMRQKAASLLSRGVSVIVDGVHARCEERDALAQLAQAQAVPFTGLWLDLDEARRIDRVSTRTHDASDADGRIAAQQNGYALGEIRWTRLEARHGVDACVNAARAALE